jgi:signal peptidase I
MSELQGQPQGSLRTMGASEAAVVATPVSAAPAVVPHARTLRWELWLRDLFISLAIAAFIIIFIYQPVKVEGTSMMPSLADHERIFVNKFVYRLEPN